ncbi:MAG: cell division protein SepF [Clostridia bacterium]|nr:MAG: cell division protein SepF [Clostridia bacterium]
MASFFNRVWSFLGLEEEVEEESWEPENETQRSNIIRLPSARSVKVCLFHPLEYADVQKIAEALRNRCPVVLNLENTPRTEAQRIIDFLGGTVYALEGRMVKVTQAVFVLAPQGIELTGEQLYELGTAAM